MGLISRIKQTWGTLDESWRFAITAFLIARTFYALWSWVVLTIQPVAVHYVEADHKPAVLFLNLYTIESHTYVREVNGESLTFRAVSRNTVMDLQTGSLWDVDSGRALEGYFKGLVLPSATSPTDMFAYFHATPYPNAWLAVWQRFDANWYVSIAEQGYGSIPEDIHFPPLYPLLISITKPLTGNAFASGLIISHVAAIYALKLLLDVFNQWGKTPRGKQTLGYFLAYPTSFFLFSAYTESLFLVTALLALRHMQNKSWSWAGFWIFCSVLTRLQGVALLLPMAYLMWKDAPFLRRPGHWFGAAIAGIGPLFYIYLRSTLSVTSVVALNEPSLYARLVPPWTSYLYAMGTLLSGVFNYVDLLNWLSVTLFFILLLLGWRTVPVEFNLYAMFSLLIIITRVVETQPLMSMSRYSLTLFPAFHIISLADRNPWIRRIVVYTCIALNLFLSAEFFGWGFVA
jgi:hypothetical protein